MLKCEKGSKVEKFEAIVQDMQVKEIQTRWLKKEIGRIENEKEIFSIVCLVRNSDGDIGFMLGGSDNGAFIPIEHVEELIELLQGVFKAEPEGE